MTDIAAAERRRATARRARLQAGAAPLLVRLLQLRHLVLDHLDPGRLLHHVRLRPGTTAARPRSRSAGRSSRRSSWSSGCACPSWFPRSRRPAASTGGPASSAGSEAGYYTGWLNLIGLIAILASVAYGGATFLDLSRPVQLLLRERLLARSGLPASSWSSCSCVTVINIFPAHLLAVINNVRCGGTSPAPPIVVLICVFGPEPPASFSFVFTDRLNNSGFGGGTTSG